jgi:hypothetical protein
MEKDRFLPSTASAHKIFNPLRGLLHTGKKQTLTAFSFDPLPGRFRIDKYARSRGGILPRYDKSPSSAYG